MSAQIRRFNVAVSVTLRSPFIMAGVEASGIGIDTPALRDQQGQPVLPGDHLKGLVLEAMRALNEANSALLDHLKIADLFGVKSAAERDDKTTAPDPRAPDRGTLRFRDLVAMDCGDHAEITRIAINEETGAVKTGALQVVELVAGLGKEVCFKGDLLFYGTIDQAKALESVLKMALKLVPFFGGLRSAGFGEHCYKEASVTISAITGGKSPGWPNGKSRAAITASFDRAFMAAVDRVADNVFVSGSYLPGAAIKGALADMLTMLGRAQDLNGRLGDALSKLHISHAIPVSAAGDELDLPIPLSIMRAANKPSLFGDAIQSAEPGLMKCDDGVYRCADFQPDWKDDHHSDARDLSGRGASELAALPRVHTKILRETGTASESDLFAEVARGHLSDARTGQRQEFRFTVDASACNMSWPETQELLDMLTTGLDAVGKTHARFEVKAVKEVTAPTVTGYGPWRILLETEAPLLDPDGPDKQYSTVKECLGDYFALVFDGAVKLEYHFCQRRIAGGYALQRRRLVSTYTPQSFFKAGSCFLIEPVKGREQEAADKLQELLKTGLPVAMADSTGKVTRLTDWRKTGYLPEHGYGRISVDDPVFKISRKATGGQP